MFRTEVHQLIEHGRKEVVVDVPVDRQWASIGKGSKETLDLASKLQPDLRPQPGRSGAGNSKRPHGSETAIEAAAMVDQQADFVRRRQRETLEEVQMEDQGEKRPLPERLHGVCPAGAVYDYAGAAEPARIVTSQNGLCDALRQTTVIGVHDWNEPRLAGGHG